MEKKTVEVPKTVMEEKTVNVPKTVMETRYTERPIAVTCQALTGLGVINDAGEDLGKIEDVMIDLDSWRINYVVLAYKSGFLSGSKYFAIPPQAFSIRESDRETYNNEGMDRKLVLNVPKQSLKDAEGFDKDNWPRNPDRTWLNNLYGRYGYTPYWKETREYKEEYREYR